MLCSAAPCHRSSFTVLILFSSIPGISVNSHYYGMLFRVALKPFFFIFVNPLLQNSCECSAVSALDLLVFPPKIAFSFVITEKIPNKKLCPQNTAFILVLNPLILLT